MQWIEVSGQDLALIKAGLKKVLITPDELDVKAGDNINVFFKDQSFSVELTEVPISIELRNTNNGIIDAIAEFSGYHCGRVLKTILNYKYPYQTKFYVLNIS